MENHESTESDDYEYVESDEWKRYLAIEEQPRYLELRSWFMRDPHVTWPLLLELLAEVPEEMIHYVGCGPLEDFVNKYGAEFVDQLEAEARVNERFRVAVIEVNLSEGRLPRDVESRLVAAFGERFRLLPPLDDDPPRPAP